MRQETLPLLVLAALLVPALAAAHSGGGEHTQFVNLRLSRTSPLSVEARLDEHVTFANGDDAPHRILADGGAFDSGEIAPGATWEWSTKSVGEFAFRCTVHPGARGLTGTIVVKTARGANEAPVVVVTEPAEGATVSGIVPIRGRTTDANGDGFHTRFRVDDGEWVRLGRDEAWGWGWDTRALVDGPHLLQVAAQDSLGEYSAVVTRTVTTKNGNEPPEPSTTPKPDAGPTVDRNRTRVAITSPADGSAVTGAIVARGFAAPPDGAGAHVPITVYVRVDGGGWKPASGGRSWSLELGTLPDGPHVVEARAETRGHWSDLAASRIHVGVPPPSVAIASPADGSVLEEAGAVRGTATDADEVLVRLDGGEWRAATGVAAWTFPLDPSRLAPGRHVVEAVAARGDHRSRPAAIELVVPQLDPPRLAVDTPLAGAILDGPFLVSGIAAATAGVASVEVRLGSGDWLPADGRTEWRVLLTPRVAPGEHALVARVTDRDGRTALEEIPVVVRAPAAASSGGGALGLLALPLPGALALVGLALAAALARGRAREY